MGHSSTYKVTYKGKESTMEMAVIGKEGTAYWYERTFSSPKGEMVLKTLEEVGANGLVTRRTIMQMAGQPPMEITQQMMGMFTSQMPPLPKVGDPRATGTNLGKEEIQTPDGKTYMCDHWRDQDGSDIWLHEDVHPTHVVKMVSRTSEMILTGTNSNYKTKITAEPQRMTFPGE